MKKNEKSDSGEPYKYFEYKLKGFDKDGKEKRIRIHSSKKTYVKMHSYAYTTQIKKGVSAWEEVKKDELPAKVKEKLGAK
ncbi:DUF1093 domain-containing protein [Bacillus paranthracis]